MELAKNVRIELGYKFGDFLSCNWAIAPSLGANSRFLSFFTYWAEE